MIYVMPNWASTFRNGYGSMIGRWPKSTVAPVFFTFPELELGQVNSFMTFIPGLKRMGNLFILHGHIATHTPLHFNGQS